jgi:hypothetical protein
MILKIHPNLRLEASVAFIVGLGFMLFGLFLLFWGLVLCGTLVGWIRWFTAGSFQGSLVGWLVPALCFLSGGVLVYLGRHLLMVYRGWLLRVTWLLSNTQPRKMILTFPQYGGARGRIAELREDGKPEGARRGEVVDVRSPQWKIKDLSANCVDVFREVEPEGIVAIMADYGVIWGFRKLMDLSDEPAPGKSV